MTVDECLIDLPRDPITKPPQRLQDLQLVCRSQTGDADAFAELVVRYRARIFTVVFRIVRHEQDALDIVQDVFFKAWQSIHQFEGRSSFYAWLYRLTMNMTFYSVRRKGQRKDEVLSDAIPSSLPSPRLNCQRIEIGVWLKAAFTKLSAEHRAVVLLKELEGMQYHEIAAFLNISVGTVMSRLFYAKRRLRSLLRPIYKQL
jgi:RNA polymerase sigma-70 factor, ECF subfamily